MEILPSHLSDLPRAAHEISRGKKGGRGYVIRKEQATTDDGGRSQAPLTHRSLRALGTWRRDHFRDLPRPVAHRDFFLTEFRQHTALDHSQNMGANAGIALRLRQVLWE
jgi:hypothetical protein